MPPSDRLLLDHQLCFALYSTSLAMTQLYKPHLEKLGLTYTQYTIMLLLWEQDKVSLKEISTRLGQKSGALTPVIKRMEADKLLVRGRGEQNDRTLTIRLTEKGNSLRHQGLAVNRCVAEACDMPDEELIALKDRLLALRAKISG